MKYITSIKDHVYTIDVNRDNEVVINGEKRPLDLRLINDGLYSMLIDSKSHEVLVEEHNGEYHVLINGVLYNVNVMDERAKRLAEAAGAFASTSAEVNIKSPMPGLIVAVRVVEGDEVKKGQVLVVLESMKMENEIKSPREGTVTAINVAPRQTVEQNQLMIVIS
jgi:biotin carboxyl carrier protein